MTKKKLSQLEELAIKLLVEIQKEKIKIQLYKESSECECESADQNDVKHRLFFESAIGQCDLE